MKRVLAVFLALLLCGCGKAAAQEPIRETTAPLVPRTAEEVPAATVPPEVAAEAQALAEAPKPAVSVVLQPDPAGIREERTADAVVDYSHTEDGYVMVRYLSETDKRLKVQLKGPATTYTYDLPVDKWTVLPLSDGEGPYKAVVYKNVSGTGYATVMAASFDVTLTDEFAPFLRPNQYVNYAQAPRSVERASILCAGLDHPLEKVAAVYDYVVTNLVYDQEKAATVQSGYLPVLDQVLEEKRGICFDYASLMTAMLRCQSVPCKLVVGYVGSTYHAWISVWTEENGWVDGAIFFNGRGWERMDPTFASSGERSEEIMDFIRSADYRVKYLY